MQPKVVPIGEIMQHGGLGNSIMSTEDLEVGYYSNAKIELLNNQSNQATTYFLS